MEEIFDKFKSPTLGSCSFEKVVSELTDFVNKYPESKYSIVVGSDSETKNGSAEFVSVIAVHRIGSGGRYFWNKHNSVKVYSMRDRIYKEALFSLDLAQKIIGALKDKIAENQYGFEIHVDIGQVGPTKDMIREITGMIRGHGFVPKIKPYAFGASNVADKYA
jgi:predicted RNase H-related nuclease YkuK (DUF458 family)